jgi:hypothetical protein
MPVHKKTIKKIKSAAKRGISAVGKAQRKSDRFVAKSVRKATRGVSKGASATAKRLGRARVTTNVSKGPFTSAFKFAKKIFRGGRKVGGKSPFKKFRKAIRAKAIRVKAARRRPRR